MGKFFSHRDMADLPFYFLLVLSLWFIVLLCLHYYRHSLFCCGSNVIVISGSRRRRMGGGKKRRNRRSKRRITLLRPLTFPPHLSLLLLIFLLRFSSFLLNFIFLPLSLFSLFPLRVSSTSPAFPADPSRSHTNNEQQSVPAGALNPGTLFPSHKLTSLSQELVRKCASLGQQKREK